MRVFTRITFDMLTGAVLESDSYEYDGPLELACGATGQQKQIAGQQQQLLGQLTNQSKDIFGDSSQVFQDLTNTFAPIVAAGPNQQGFSAPELSALNSAAITNTGQAYRNASQAIKENEASIGGGNMALPGGAEIGAETQVANQGAAQTASALNQITQSNYETGRENYFKAAAGLESAPEVFNPATSAGSAATNSGTAAANTANQIAQENNSWVSAVTGALGGIAGSVATGGMSNLGEGVGFFGQNAPAPGGGSGGSSSPADFSGFTYEGP